ncbi:hypothetical protein F5Y16DRAFT_394864 [Xylariaceae sp. FL0255]|nr:hypothetical protein F5Y16DRAFT_394864 [Xylariaceae sp. FL0255]
MTKLEIDTEAQTVTVDPGIRIHDLIGNILEAGYQTLGVIGATIGAGIGPFQGLCGLMIDGLQSVILVTASGDVVKANKSKNHELFFGIRGAGASFVIITSATYCLTKAVNGGQFSTADLILPPSV